MRRNLAIIFAAMLGGFSFGAWMPQIWAISGPIPGVPPVLMQYLNNLEMGTELDDDVIDSRHYVAGSIDNEHLAANSVDSDNYVDGSIDAAHLAANSVDSDSYVDGSIDTAHYAAASVDATALGADSVAESELADSLGVVQSSHVNCTAAAIGTGAACTIVAAPTGAKNIVVWDVKVMALGGNAATCTSIEIEDANGTPVVVASYAAAALTQDALLLLNSANVTLTGASLGAELTAATALVGTTTGSDCTTATSFDIWVLYSIAA